MREAQSDLANALHLGRRRIMLMSTVVASTDTGRGKIFDVARISCAHTPRCLLLFRRDAIPLTEETLDELRRGRRPRYRPARDLRRGSLTPQHTAPPTVTRASTPLFDCLTRNPTRALVPLWHILVRAFTPAAMWVPLVVLIPVVFSFVSVMSEKVSAIVFAGYESGSTSGDGPSALYILLFWGAVVSSVYLAALSVVCDLDRYEWTDALFCAVCGVVAGFCVLVGPLLPGAPAYTVWLLLPAGAGVIATTKVVRNRLS